MTVNFTITGQKQLNARLTAIGRAPREMLREIATRSVFEAQHTVAHKTGNLRRTIRMGALTPDYVEVRAGGQNDVGYAAAVEFGSKPHIIRPRKARILAWGGPRTLAGGLRKGGKATNFAMLVHHPGTRPRPYLIPAIENALKLVGLGDLVKRWNGAA